MEKAGTSDDHLYENLYLSPISLNGRSHCSPFSHDSPLSEIDKKQKGVFDSVYNLANTLQICTFVLFARITFQTVVLSLLLKKNNTLACCTFDLVKVNK